MTYIGEKKMTTFIYSAVAGFLGAITYCVSKEIERANEQEKRAKALQKIRTTERKKEEEQQNNR